MPHDNIAVAQDGDGLWTITLDRPDKANALSTAMLTALCETVEAAQTSARALILTGRGRVFSAGADLDEAPHGLASSPLWERLSGAVAGHTGLTICALNGTIAGGAMGMALACDLRVAVAQAQMFYPVMRRGYLPHPSDVRRLRALAGPARAKMILLGGARITATQAQDWGLIDRIVPSATPEPALEATQAIAPNTTRPPVEDVVDCARALCTDALAATPAHATTLKRMVADIPED